MVFVATVIHSWLPLVIILIILGLIGTVAALLFFLHVLSKWMGS